MMNLKEVFQALPQRFRPEKAPTFQGRFHFDFGEQKYTVHIQAAQVSVKAGLEGEATCTIQSPADLYLAIETGEKDAQSAIMSGELRIDNLPAMMQYSQLFYPLKKSNSGAIKLEGAEARRPQNGPLKGLKVLDFTRLLPGPLGTMLMADMGAEVIKVEAPEFYDYTRDFPPKKGGESAGYLAFNRSKRSLSLDYSKPEGKAIILELLPEIDIVIEQFRPGVMAKMGLGYEDLKKVNDQLIYVSITGYGQTGPYAHLAGHDLNYISLGGILSGNKNQAPQSPLVQMADIAGGSYMSVIACLAAVYSRQESGKGQYVDVSMLDGVMPLAVNAKAVQWVLDQNIQRDESMLSGGLINYGIYQAQDGRYIALGTLEAKFWERFCDIIGKSDWKGRMYTQDKQKLAEYRAELSTLFKTQTGRYWHDLGIKEDLLLNLVYEQDEIDQDPQIQAREMVVEMDHPSAGKIKTLGVPLKFSDTKAQAAWPPPKLGEDTLAILREAGLKDDQIQALAEKGVLKCSKHDI